MQPDTCMKIPFQVNPKSHLNKTQKIQLNNNKHEKATQTRKFYLVSTRNTTSTR